MFEHSPGGDNQPNVVWPTRVTICDKSLSNQIAHLFMKRKLLLLSVATSAAALLSGCKTCCSEADQPTASATPAPAAVAIPAVTAPPPSKPLPPTIRINAGIGAVKDSTGVTWLEDTGFIGGDVI